MAGNLRATEVFVPSDFPALTYVNRADDKHEQRLRDAFETPKTVISVSGPSKTGKTVLVQKTLGEDNIIPIYGAQVRHPEGVWSAILNWIDAPSQTTQTSGKSESVTPEVGAGAKFKVPGVAELSLSSGLKGIAAASSGATVTKDTAGLAAVAREIANSDFTVFFDDFHYIPREIQSAVGKQIKAGSEVGIRFCIASVPHRADDVVRSNPELRGRTVNVDTEFWSVADLVKIGELGFAALNIEISEAVLARLAEEACTSPQIMQALCLQLCFAINAREKADTPQCPEISDETIGHVLEETSGRADYSSLLKQMHAGPRTRGTERKTFKFKDGSEGDAYRAALLALVEDPPAMGYNYAEITKRIEAICVDDKPSGSSVTGSYEQIEGFAHSMFPDQKIIEWDADAASGTLSIIDPYFLFYLRSSDKLSELGRSKRPASIPLFEGETK